MSDKHATYCGPIEHLSGKGALIRTATHKHVVAQFDDKTLTRRQGVGVSPALQLPYDALGYGWHAFPESHFKVDP